MGNKVKPDLLCARCSRRGASNHHLLAKSIYPEYREEPMNLIPLCDWHHTMDGRNCPHGNPEAQAAFNLWMKHNRPAQFAWMVEHSRKEIKLPTVKVIETKGGK
jgi:hypothetical protein